MNTPLTRMHLNEYPAYAVSNDDSVKPAKQKGPTPEELRNQSLSAA